MSNARPLDLADRLRCVDPDEIRETMTPRQARQFERMASRHQYRVTGEITWTEPPTPWAKIRGERGSILAEYRRNRSGRMWEGMYRCSLFHGVAAYCDPSSCPRRHARARLHTVPRADLARLLRAAGSAAATVLRTPA